MKNAWQTNGTHLLPRKEQAIEALNLSILNPEESDKPRRRKCPITVL